MKRPFKLLLSYFLIVVYTIAVFKSLLPFAQYQLNYEYISTTLCVNKTNEILDCNGKCYLVKELKKTIEEESGKSKKGNIIVKAEEIPLENYLISFIPFYQETNFLSLQSSGLFISQYLESVAPPPEC